MLRQLRDQVLLKALLALLVCAYALPGAASLCVSGNGHSLGYDCGCGDCQPLQNEPGEACQLACCLESAHLAFDAAVHEGQSAGNAADRHSGKCCTHHKLHAMHASLDSELPLVSSAFLYALPALPGDPGEISLMQLDEVDARGSPPPLPQSRLLMLASTQLRL